ncbi:probable serine hydrolase [Condylostylus longicornis]|uniref:probable serine hydrolase n=1 Tax=Condylostylus longicornis TaxID=2530218 RepID=UPI00244E518A|nr:probable serine hydrolase [Condylostylus longicornis]XP_055376275.1 probable serine hydrolase [Condylostylus longicornis]
MNPRYLPLQILKKLSMKKYNQTAILQRKFLHSGQIPFLDELSQDYEEVEIPVPWGHVSGKWYGPKHIRPIVGLHGWQDNSGTFDTLAPLLPQNVAFLSIDLPGHGLSSRLPDGMWYDSAVNLQVLHLLMKEYNWDKISIIGHSMSSIASFIFSALFPEKVEMVVGLDALKPHIRSNDKVVETMRNRMKNFIIADERNRDKSEPPSYTYEDLVEKLYVGTFHSIDKDKCKHILARNIKKSLKYPDQYFFARDSRLKSYNYTGFWPELNLELAKRINVPYLFIKCTGSTYFESKEYFDEALEVMKKNPKFEFYEAEGSHHVHLNEPEKISAIINPFIEKYHTAKEDYSKKREGCFTFL